MYLKNKEDEQKKKRNREDEDKTSESENEDKTSENEDKTRHPQTIINIRKQLSITNNTQVREFSTTRI